MGADQRRHILTPQEQNELDEWFIRNASPRLDLRILF
jgi:hypothetical protein